MKYNASAFKFDTVVYLCFYFFFTWQKNYYINNLNDTSTTLQLSTEPAKLVAYIFCYSLILYFQSLIEELGCN